MTSLVSSNLNCTWSSPYWRCADNILVVVGLICKAQLSISGLVRCPCQFVITSKQASARYIERWWKLELQKAWGLNVKYHAMSNWLHLSFYMLNWWPCYRIWNLRWLSSELNNQLSYWDQAMLLLIIVNKLHCLFVWALGREVSGLGFSTSSMTKTI